MKPRITFLFFVICFLAALVPAQLKETSSVVETNPEYAIKVIDEINGIRLNPGKYSSYLENYLDRLRGDVLYLKSRLPFKLNDGPAGIKEGVKFLSDANRVLPMMRSEVLDKAAASQLADLLENPQLGHFGKDGADLGKRLARFGRRNGPVAENIAFDDETPRQVALSWAIDDGVPSRQHRKNLVNTDFLMIGAACGKTAKKQSICVAIFAKQIFPNDINVPELMPEELD